LRRLALYFDVGTELWELRSSDDWKALTSDGWDRLFRPGIGEEAAETPEFRPGADDDAGTGLVARTYVLKPVDGRLLYLRRGRDARRSQEEAVQEADLQLDAVSLHLSRASAPVVLHICEWVGV
jgi:hypothetical protein